MRVQFFRSMFHVAKHILAQRRKYHADILTPTLFQNYSVKIFAILRKSAVELHEVPTLM